MNKIYNIGGLLNLKEQPPQDLLDTVVEIFDKLTKVRVKTYCFPDLGINVLVNCDKYSSWVSFYDAGQYDFMRIRVSRWSADFFIRMNDHALCIEDDSSMLLSKWRQTLFRIHKKNLTESVNAGSEDGMAEIREFLSSVLKSIDKK
jgi:hypothetical protein